VNPRSVVPKLSIRVNIHEVLPVKDVRVPAIRNNDVHEADESSIYLRCNNNQIKLILLII